MTETCWKHRVNEEPQVISVIQQDAQYSMINFIHNIQ